MNKFIPNISKLKYKKPRKSAGTKNKNNIAIKSNKIIYGFYGFQALENGFINPQEIEACRRSVVKKLKKEGKLWIRCYPYKSFTSKGLGQRMGRGKGNISKWTFPVKTGQILFELECSSISDLKLAFRSVSFKLGIKIKLKKKYDTKRNLFKNIR